LRRRIEGADWMRAGPSNAGAHFGIPRNSGDPTLLSPTGQKAHYMLRWVTTRGDKGPGIETVSATIGG